MKVIIAGSRSITDFPTVQRAVKESGFKVTVSKQLECRPTRVTGPLPTEKQIWAAQAQFGPFEDGLLREILAEIKEHTKEDKQ